MTENRQAQRISFECSVDFESAGVHHVCDLIDISLQGALIGNCQSEDLEVDAACKLTLNLDEAGENQIIMEGTITHQQQERIGMRCESIDESSLSHLRRLVEYNIGDMELLERDTEMLFRLR